MMSTADFFTGASILLFMCLVVFLQVAALSGGFSTHYTPRSLEVKDDFVVIYATKRGGWVEQLWESDEDAVLLLHRQEGNLINYDGSKHERGKRYPAVHTLLYEGMSVFVEEVVTHEDKDLVTAKLKFNDSEVQQLFVRMSTPDGPKWHDARTMLFFDPAEHTWMKSLSNKLEQAYQAREVQQSFLAKEGVDNGS